MRTSKFTPEQMVHILRQGESGVPIGELCRQHQISEQTYYRWNKQFGDLGTAEVRELRQLREENRKLKQLVADLSLDKQILREVIAKRSDADPTAGPGRVGAGGVSPEPATGLPSARGHALERAVHRSSAAADSPACAHPPDHRGARKLRVSTDHGLTPPRRLAGECETDLSTLQGRKEGLGLRRKRPKRRRSAVARQPRPVVTRPNERWSMDFMSDALANGQKLRVLTIVDAYTR